MCSHCLGTAPAKRAPSHSARRPRGHGLGWPLSLSSQVPRNYRVMRCVFPTCGLLRLSSAQDKAACHHPPPPPRRPSLCPCGLPLHLLDSLPALQPFRLLYPLFFISGLIEKHPQNIYLLPGLASATVSCVAVLSLGWEGAQGTVGVVGQELLVVEALPCARPWTATISYPTYP